MHLFLRPRQRGLMKQLHHLGADTQLPAIVLHLLIPAIVLCRQFLELQQQSPDFHDRMLELHSILHRSTHRV